MPSFTFTSPEGQKYTVNGPDGATPDQAFSILQEQIGASRSLGGMDMGDVGSSLNTGLNRGVDALLGLPGDVVHGATYLADKALGRKGPINDVLPTSWGLGARRQAFQGQMDYQPKSRLGRYAETIGEFLPGASAAPIKFGVIPAVASETAGELTQGTTLEPYARVAGAIGGAFSPGVARLGARGVKSFTEPFTNEGVQNIAARSFRNRLTDPRKAQIALEAAKAMQQPGAGLGEFIPGSRPTTGQLMGDQGGLQLERELANENRDLYHENPYGTGADQQKAAQSALLGSIQPTGVATDVSDAIRSRLADLEATHDKYVQDALGKAQTEAARNGKGMSPEAQGEALRSALQASRDATKVKERSLWDAIDPDGTLTAPFDPVKSDAAGIVKAVSRLAQPMSGKEAAIFDDVKNSPSIIPFNDMTALRSRISTAMREELRTSGQSPSYARLSQLRGAVESAIENAAVHKSVVDDEAVTAGTMAEGDSLRSRLEVLDSDASTGKTSGQSFGRDVVGARTSSPSGAVAEDRAARQGDGRPRNDARRQGIPGYVAGDKVYHPAGSFDVTYEIANLPDLITSHDTNFNVNRSYPQDLQPRFRGSKPARDQVNIMAARLHPERLGRSAEANSGAPIVGPDNVVESGNGRTLALAKLYQSGRGDAYRRFLASQGFETSGVPYPVLIARRTTALSPEARASFTHAANTASGLRMNAAEQAMADAKLISPQALDAITDGSSINSEKNRPFVRSFLSQLPATERGGMLDAQGNLSQAGISRLEAAMSARAYSDADVIAKSFDAVDSNIRGLAGALTDASGSWMRMRQAAREGVIDPKHDITPELMNAVRAVIRARDAGRPVSEVLNQTDMFGGETSSLAKSLIVNNKGALASRDTIASRLQRYANEAQKNLSAPSIFGDVIRPDQVLRTVLDKDSIETRSSPTPISQEPASAVPREAPATEPSPTYNLDEGAVARHKAASAATKQRAIIFDQGPIGDVLRKRGGAQDYRLPVSAVPGKLWVPGARGAETVEAYVKAAGSPDALIDTASESLRRETMTPEGIIDPSKFARWRKRYADALRALPMGIQAKFENAASASQAYQDAAVARKRAIDASQTSLVKRMVGLSNSQDIVKTVGAIFGSRNAVEQMRELSGRLSGNPDAQEGLKKAIADYMTNLATATSEAGASGVNNLNASMFSRFVARNGSALREAGFTEAQISNLRALSNDLQRSKRTMQATALPASPNSAADVIAAMRNAAKKAKGISLLSKLLASTWAGFHVGGLYGAATGSIGAIGEHLVQAMRGAGLSDARDIVVSAILDPETGRQLLRRASALPDGDAERALAKTLFKRSIFALPGAYASVTGSQNASVNHGLARVSGVLSQPDTLALDRLVQQRTPLANQVRSSLDKFGRASAMLKASPNPANATRFMISARNLSANLADAGINIPQDRITATAQ